MEIRLPNPHPGLIRIRKEARRFNILAAGRRFFKSTHLMSLAVEAAIEGQQVLIGAPVYSQVQIIWREMKEAAGGVFRFNEMKGEVTVPNGGVIFFRSLNQPDNCRGITANLALLDEAGTAKEDVWLSIIRPMLISTGGGAWLAGTPAGRNYFHAEFMNSRDRNDSIAWQIPTVGCRVQNGELIREPNPYENPLIPFSEIENYFRTVPEQTFRSEILAEFAEQSNPVFRNVRKCATAEHYERRQGSWRYIISCDLAKFQDYSVFTVLDITNKQVVFIDRFTNLDYTTQADRLSALYERFRPEATIIESAAAGEPFCEWMEKRGVPVTRFITTNASKKKIIESLALAFERGRIRIPNNETLINELLSFQSERLPSGKISYAAPEGLTDDCVMSLAFGWDYLSGDRRVELVTLEPPWGRRR